MYGKLSALVYSKHQFVSQIIIFTGLTWNIKSTTQSCRCSFKASTDSGHIMGMFNKMINTQEINQ